MKKCKMLLSLIMVFSLMFGMQVQAEDSGYKADVQIAAADGMDLQNVKVGDIVKFNITMTNISDEELGGGSDWMVVDATDQDGTRAGNVEIPEEGNPDIGSRNNVITTGVASAVIKNFTPDKTICATGTVTVTESMKGKQITVSTKIIEDRGDKIMLSPVAQISFEVMGEEPAEDTQIKVEATPSIDINNIVKAQPFQVKVKVTNVGPAAIEHAFVDSAYSETELAGTGEILTLGTIIPQDGIQIMEDGSGYLGALESGASVEITMNCTIPAEYGKNSVYLFFAGIATKSDSLADLDNDLIALDAATLNGKIKADNPEKPEKPEKQEPSITDPTKPQTVQPTKKIEPAVKPAVKSAAKSPKTGDTAPIAELAFLMVCAGTGMVITMKKKQIF